MKKIAIFATGSGSNFQAIIDAIESGSLDAKVCLLVCDKPGAFVLERAAKHHIPTFVFSAKNYPNKIAYELAILAELKQREVEFLVLAGYMRLIGATLLHEFEGRIVNIHPSLLPQFPGLDAIGQALAAGVKVTGGTIHYVDAGMDTGPIIEQQEVEVVQDETLETLQAKIHAVEHKLYPAVLQRVLVQNEPVQNGR
jgi:formyltetrahydrofolate-dependent phosphoribosylglycinamide formyltransferase